MNAFPPGPRLPSLVQSGWWAMRPQGFAEACRRRYGSIFTARLYPLGPVVHVADPELVRQVLTGPPDRYLAGEANRVVEFVVGPRSLLLLDDQEHASRRRVLTPAFRGESVQAYVPEIEEIVTGAIASWPRNQPVRLHHRLQDITLDVMMRVVFGIRDAARLEELRGLVPQLLRLHPALVLYPALRRDLGRYSPWGRFARARDRVDTILRDQLIRRRQGDSQPERDVLSRLLDCGEQIPDDELRDHLVTLLVVGHETSATALGWTIERLVRHPQVYRRLRTDIEKGRTAYLDAVINEALRVRPVTMDVARTLTQSTELGGYLIPAGTMVALSIGLMHSSPELYDQPDEFRPERFIGRPAVPYFLPFGGGTHRCLGANFALQEMRVALAILLATVDLEPADPRPEPAKASGPMLIPARGTQVVLRTRHVDEHAPEPRGHGRVRGHA